MKKARWGACGLVAAALACSAAPASGASSDLNAYRVKATAKNLKALNAAGFDVTEGRDRKKGTIEVVGTAAKVRQAKVTATIVRDQGGLTVAQRSRRNSPRAKTRTRRGFRADNASAVAAATAGASDKAYKVWTKYDAVEEAGTETDPDKEQYTEEYARLVAEHPGLVAKRVTGTTYGGREIVALQVTKGATGSDIPGRPAVLYNAMQHAREWLAGETCRRTPAYFVDNYGKTTSAGPEVTKP